MRSQAGISIRSAVQEWAVATSSRRGYLRTTMFPRRLRSVTAGRRRRCFHGAPLGARVGYRQRFALDADLPAVRDCVDRRTAREGDRDAAIGHVRIHRRRRCQLDADHTAPSLDPNVIPFACHGDGTIGVRDMDRPGQGLNPRYAPACSRFWFLASRPQVDHAVGDVDRDRLADASTRIALRRPSSRTECARATSMPPSRCSPETAATSLMATSLRTARILASASSCSRTLPTDDSTCTRRRLGTVRVRCA